MEPTVHSLRKQGFKVRVYHWRYVNNILVSAAFNKTILDPKGGKTQVTVTYPTGESYVGEATCSKTDCFNRKLGVKIALGRIVKNVAVAAISKAL